MAVENWLAGKLDYLVAFRHDLHEHPELLYDVDRTAARVAAELRAAGVDEVIEGVGRTGVVGIINGRTNVSGKMIGLRSDMDALPILEVTGRDYASKTPGIMHACGHDGHATMLLGAAIGLAESRNFDGKVAVIFQPAEEGGRGALAMVEDGLFKRWPISEVYGMHNLPDMPIGEFGIAPGGIMGSVDVLEIEIEGRGGHAAKPDQTIDPIPVMAAMVQGIQTVVSRRVNPIEAAVVSICAIEAGDAFNIIPQTVKLKGTVRTLNETVRADIEKRLHKIVATLADAFDCDGRLTYTTSCPVTWNHPDETVFAGNAAAAVTGETRVNRALPPTLGGEDFAFMLQEVPGAVIQVGNGPSAGLHHPAYDFNDDAIAYGTSYWCELVRQRLPLVG